MKIAIIGTRGIPNNYGGFEQFAEYLALGLIKRGIEVSVYNPHNHIYKEEKLEGVNIIRCYDPEYKLGTIGQFIYDFLCIKDARKRDFDIILQLGYTSSSIWSWLFPKKSIVTTNMDGLEWKRTKFSEKVKKFLLFAERLAVKKSDYLIADSIGIQDYIKNTYQKESVYIPYGSNLFNNPDVNFLSKYDLKKYEYCMLIARLEPENSIEIILDGVVLNKSQQQFLVIGKHSSAYGEYLKDKYKEFPHIRFIGGIYDINVLNNLRFYSNLYFHGHTVGGTNPSLLEAMASNALICANDNPFNRYILEGDAYYFKDAADVAKALRKVRKEGSENNLLIDSNRKKIGELYDWDKIISQYLDHFNDILRKGLKR